MARLFSRACGDFDTCQILELLRTLLRERDFERNFVSRVHHDVENCRVERQKIVENETSPILFSFYISPSNLLC